MHTTHKGLEVELYFFEADPNDSKGMNEGWVCHRVEARVGEEVVGYLKIEYVPSETLAEKVPTVWHLWCRTDWWAQQGDWGQVWASAHRALHTVPPHLLGVVESSFMLSAEHIPEDEGLIQAELAALVEATRDRRDGPWVRHKEFKHNHLDRPKVGFIRTLCPSSWEEGTNWQRKGIATLLYIEGAKWLAREKGLPLWASTLQQGPPRKAWEAMAGSGKYPIIKRPVPWKPEEQVYTLDYTQTGGSA